jgi:hypothetical protein
MIMIFYTPLPMAFLLGSLFIATIAPAQGTFVFNPANGHYYEAVRGNISWPVANEAAAARTYLGNPGHLVAISSAEENAFIFELVYTPVFTNFPGITGLGDWVWLGGFQPPGSLEPADDWSWVTEEPFDFSNWDAGQPSDTAGNPNGSQNFLLMWAQGFWNDAAGPGFGGNPVAGYIVEYEPVPEPNIALLAVLGMTSLFLFHRKRNCLTSESTH